MPRTDHRTLDEIARSQHWVVSLRQALETGLGPDAAKKRVRSGRWTRLYPGVYLTVPGPPTFEQRLMGACLSGGPTAVVSHGAAAVVWGVLDGPQPIEITVREGRPRSRDLIVHRTTSLGAHERTRIDGIPVTTQARTLLSLAPRLDPLRLEVVADALMRTGLDPQRLVDYLHRPRNRRAPGSARLRRIAAERNLLGVPKSVLETEFTQLLRALRLPQPLRQYRVVTREGPYDIDSAYPERRLAIETDGRQFHLGRERKDAVRQAAVERLGWEFLRFGKVDVRVRGLETGMLVAAKLGLVPRGWRPGRTLAALT